MEEKTTKSMNLALERPTERLYVLIPTEMERLLNEKAKEMNTKIAIYEISSRFPHYKLQSALQKSHC